MTEATDKIEQPPASRCGKKHFILSLCAVLMVASGASFATLHCPWLRPSVARQDAGVTESIIALQKRVTVLEDQNNALVKNAPAASIDTGAIDETLRNLQAQIDHLDKATHQTGQKAVAQAFAFLDLRDAALAGHPFAAQLASLHEAAGDDAIITDQLKNITPWAAQGVPDLPQLHDRLASAALTPAITPDEAPWLTKIKNLLRPLINVRTTHATELRPLEKALMTGDSKTAETVFTTLPQDQQNALNDWHKGLQDRITLEDSLRVIQTHFTTQPVSVP